MGATALKIAADGLSSSQPYPNPKRKAVRPCFNCGENRRKVFCILDLRAREIIFCVVRTPSANGMAG